MYKEAVRHAREFLFFLLLLIITRLSRLLKKKADVLEVVSFTVKHVGLRYLVKVRIIASISST